MITVTLPEWFLWLLAIYVVMKALVVFADLSITAHISRICRGAVDVNDLIAKLDGLRKRK